MQNKIAEIRNSADPKISQEELAISVGISRTHLSEIENGKAEPGGQVMLRIAQALGKSVEDIFFINIVV
ncbi:hypothetical protein SCACP_21780 [Sporomusa carbonis]|uniref:helix-turn-helix transcriptional regulator n=1 Tax=Sporomusa carbonis TaxID=3076075 RepID=UPI003A6E9571